MRKKKVYVKILGRRRNVLVFLTVTLWCLLMWCCSSWLSMLPKYSRRPSEEVNLQHLKRNRNLANYMNKVHLLVEPEQVPCPRDVRVPVVVLVASSPKAHEQRNAVRRTWGRFQPTFFLLGLTKNHYDKQLEENKIEAKQYNDLVVFDFTDHYQNLTLKTALMMYWTVGRCPQAEYMLKTDDDVLINPRALESVLRDKQDAVLVGHRIHDMLVHRAPFIKWYVPFWLYAMDVVPQHLCGAGYLIHSVYLNKILQKAYEVPLINLEDVYFTYLVAFKGLNYFLRHDWRITPKKPWINAKCAYRSWAITHGYNPEEMVSAWEKIKSVSIDNNTTCGILSSILENDFFMYYNYNMEYL